MFAILLRPFEKCNADAYAQSRRVDIELDLDVDHLRMSNGVFEEERIAIMQADQSSIQQNAVATAFRLDLISAPKNRGRSRPEGGGDPRAEATRGLRRGWR